MLRDIIIKTVEQRILSLFLFNPDRSFYSREVSKKIGASLGAASNALRLLEKNLILNSEKKGKTNLYSLSLSSPYLDRLRAMNSLLAIEPLIEKLKKISRCIVLYGSYAAGTFTAESDLDLFVVSEKREGVIKIIDSFKPALNIEVKPVVKKQIEWMRLEKNAPEFFNELDRGIVLWERPVNESSF